MDGEPDCSPLIAGRVEAQSELLYRVAFRPQPRLLSVDHSACRTAGEKKVYLYKANLRRHLVFPLASFLSGDFDLLLCLRTSGCLQTSIEGPSVWREGLATSSNFCNTGAAPGAHAQCALVKAATEVA